MTPQQSSVCGAARPDPRNSEQALRAILKDARRRQGLSQMELALRLGYSPRHISFVEVGRSRPSRALIERWLAEVKAQPSVRSAALHHAGFALGAGPRDLGHGAGPHPANGVFQRLLSTHDPYPAFLFDSNWIIRDANRSARWLMSTVMPGYLMELEEGEDVDMIAACTHPQGLLSSMRNAKSVGYALQNQLILEASANPSLVARLASFSHSLSERFGKPDCVGASPFDHLTFSFCTQAGNYDFFRFQGLVELPQDVTLHSLRVEISLPLNKDTKEAMHRADLASVQAPAAASQGAQILPSR